MTRPAATRAEQESARAVRAADAAVSAMYAAHYRSLVGLAVLLVPDGNVDTAQQVVQDSFVALHRNWRGLADRDGSGDRALVYLWQRVLNRSRCAGRVPAPREAPDGAAAAGSAAAGGASAETASPETAPAGTASAGTASAGTAPAGTAPAVVLAAMHALPRRQHEALVLQHYAGLSAAQTAQMLGISAGAVQRHTARAMSSLHGVLDSAP